MAVKFDLVKPGDTLYSVYRRKMGHTTMSETVCRQVRVLSLTEDGRGAMVSANGNSPIYLSRAAIEKLRRTPVKTTLQQMAERRRREA